MTVTSGVPYALPVPSDNLGYGCPPRAKVQSAEHAPTVPHEPGFSPAEDHSGVLCGRASMRTKFGLNNASCKGTRAGTIMDQVIPETMSPHADPCTA
jgi:hypothetical protein